MGDAAAKPLGPRRTKSRPRRGSGFPIRQASKFQQTLVSASWLQDPVHVSHVNGPLSAPTPDLNLRAWAGGHSVQPRG